MDEILVANFMVFDDIVRDDAYDLWIGDEAWELDYYLHENPELKRAAYCFLTDFVGWLPLPEGGAEEARLTADYNAEMIAQIARFPRVRDRAIFVGSPEDVVPHSFGEGLPAIRPWVEQHFDFSGYVLPPDMGAAAEREPVCIVTVGGSGVGGGMLQRVIDARRSSTTCRCSSSAARGSTRRRCRCRTASRSSRTCTSCRSGSLRARSRSRRAA